MYEEESSDDDLSLPGFDLKSSDSDDSDIERTESDNEPSSSKRPRRNAIASGTFEPGKPGYILSAPEERQMLNALTDLGTSSLKALARRLPQKSEFEIKEYMHRKRKRAMHLLKDKSKYNKKERLAPIDKWIAHLSKLIPNDNYKFKHISRAFKYIALFEDREAENGNTTGINLRDCYLILSSLLEGEGPRYTNRETSYFLYGMFQHFAKEIKEQSLLDERKYLSLNARQPNQKRYGKNKQKVSHIDDLVINPLRLPEDILGK